MNRQPLRYLPDNPTPEGTRCITITIPDDDQWERALYSAIRDLGNWNLWQRDVAHNGAVVAKQWRTALDTFTYCGDASMFDVRQKDGSPCELDKTTDGGETWTEFANLQLCPPLLRTNQGVLEWFNGSTWEPLPGAGDERQDGTYTPPWPSGSVPSGQTAECLSAENILSILTSTLTALRANIVDSELATGLAATIVGVISLFIPVALFAEIALVLGGIAESLGTSGIDDLLGSTAQENIRCNLKEHAEADGSFTSADYTAFYAQLSDNFSGLELSFLQNYFDQLGPVGLSRQGAANGIDSADCSDCPEPGCIIYDFTTGTHGWEAYPDQGQHIDGVGWRVLGSGPYPDVADIKLVLSPDRTLISAKVWFTLTDDMGSRSCAIYTNLGQWVRDDSLLLGPGDKTLTATSSGLTVNLVHFTWSGTPEAVTFTKAELCTA